MGNLIDTEQLLLIRIQSSRLIPSLTTFDQSPTLRTFVAPNKTRSLFIRRENHSLLYQDPDHDKNLDSTWNLSF